MDASHPRDDGASADGDPEGTWTRRRALLVAVAVLGASAAVAIGAAGAGLVLPPIQDEGAVRWVRIAGMAAVVVGLVGLVVQRRRIETDGDGGPDPTAAAMASAGTLLGLVLLLALLMPRTGGEVQGGAPPPTESATINPDAPRTGPPPPPSSTAPITEGSAEGEDPDEPEWRVAQSPEAEPRQGRDAGLDRALLRRVGMTLLALLLAAVVIAAIVSVRRRGRDRLKEPPPEPPVDREEAEASLVASLGELAGQGDPRHQITAAYGRLLAALAEAGAAREPHEAPYEHLRRTLGPLGVEPGPMHRLTELYVLAQFGHGAVDEGHRARAVEALEGSLAALQGPLRESVPLGS